ncbi:MAG: S8 family serine peptidase [Bacteroides sp.]|nr:S8 family serine peptidase [Bacteroides sp.]
MKKVLLLSVLALLASAVMAQQETFKFRVTLKDKGETTYSLKRPAKFLSKAALERRKRQDLPVDSTDLPVCQSYVQRIAATGVRIVVQGKWNNFVTVATNDSLLAGEIAALPFVKEVEQVWKRPADGRYKSDRRTPLENRVLLHPDSLYGTAVTQIQLSNAHKLHEAGFRGQGMTIGVIDAGFHNVDSILSMQNIRILGTRDFVCPEEADIYAESDHGLGVLSCIGMNRPNEMVGTAPEASFWLLRSEDEYSENLVEQDYWCAAVEFADSVGVDVLNTSLGYYEFDDKSKNYEFRHLDGHYALMSRQASLIADKGMLLVCSAGNAGMGPWKKITPPGDADNVVTVGAVARNGRLAPFSSIGNTADGRVKPDVVAVGLASSVVRANGNQGYASGTSFSSPIMCGMVACLWQACPKLTAKEIIELVRRSGNRAEYPDNIYGYGIPDMWKAYEMSKE